MFEGSRVCWQGRRVNVGTTIAGGDSRCQMSCQTPTIPRRGGGNNPPSLQPETLTLNYYLLKNPQKHKINKSFAFVRIFC